MFWLALAQAQATTEEGTAFPPIVYALIAAAIFIALAFVAWSFRDAANRHTNTASRSGAGNGHGHH